MGLFHNIGSVQMVPPPAPQTRIFTVVLPEWIDL